VPRKSATNEQEQVDKRYSNRKQTKQGKQAQSTRSIKSNPINTTQENLMRNHPMENHPMKSIKNPMKTILPAALLAALSLTISYSAHAVVTDRFECQVQLTETDTGESMYQSLGFDLSRLPSVPPGSPIPLVLSPDHPTPIPDNPGNSLPPSVRWTSASIGGSGLVRMENNDRVITANLTFDYMHAVKYDSSGRAIDARQGTCLNLDANWCLKAPSSNAPGGPITMCGSLSLACGVPMDPFDPSSGWSVVRLAPNGTPTFDERTLVPHVASILDDENVVHGTATFSCQYKGTYQ